MQQVRSGLDHLLTDPYHPLKHLLWVMGPIMMATQTKLGGSLEKNVTLYF